MRSVLITGGAGGIGRGIAGAFTRAGDAVVLADRDTDALAEAARLPGVRTVPLEITDPESVTAALDTIGPIEVLVNNAGLLTVHGRLLELSAADLEAVLRVNVLGTFRMTQQVAARMVAAGIAGRIVNISSIGARQPTPGMGGYESSKAAVDALTRWAAIELAEHGILVNAVAPGPVLTESLAAAMPEGSAQRIAWQRRIPLGGLAPVDQVAAAVLFLAGPDAAHITGTSLPVDGGQLLG
ncbi:SDR family NAD(P)-dependent oxidoreductase [Sciscionella marina]|uniref:SDR family NAD(P)-dependent oxidoreductase n=1 Tax=Sciscionella marina TaxID=508770 RepID=UPI00035EE8CA|nr:SDR family oxidoreductase [Sciscionella marina]